MTQNDEEELIEAIQALFRSQIHMNQLLTRLLTGEKVAVAPDMAKALATLDRLANKKERS